MDHIFHSNSHSIFWCTMHGMEFKGNIEATYYAFWKEVVELAIIIIVYFDVWTIMDKRHQLLLASKLITYFTQISIVYFWCTMHGTEFKENIEATCYAFWKEVVELAIIIIVYFDVWTIMDKRHHLLLASKWITYFTQIRIVSYDAQCMAWSLKIILRLHVTPSENKLLS
jgi:hypothetical protein